MAACVPCMRVVVLVVTVFVPASQRLCRDARAHASVLQGMESYCIRAFAEALEVIPYTLAENAGLNPIEMVTELRNKHARGETAAGINVRKGQVTNMMEENVVQPLLVTTSAITLACECVRMILKVQYAAVSTPCLAQQNCFPLMHLHEVRIACPKHPQWYFVYMPNILA